MAGLAREHAEAVRALIGDDRRSSRCLRGSPIPSCSRARSSSPTPTSASSWPSSCASVGIEADIVLEPIAPRFRSGGRGRRRARGASAIPMPCVLVLAADHVVRKPERVPRGLPAGRRGRRRGPHRDLRHRAHPPGDQLRLHPAGREAQRRSGARGRGVRREARCRDRRALRRPRAISGTAATSCSTPTSCWARSSASSRPWREAAKAAVAGLTRDLDFLRLAAERVRARAEEVDRLCGDGAHQARRRGAGRSRLVRRRQLERGLGRPRARRRRQRDRRPGRHAGQPQQPGALRGVDADHRGRARRRHRGVDRGRRAGRGARQGRAGQGAGRAAQGAEPSRGGRASAHLPALGLLPGRRHRARATRSSASS